MSGDNKTHNFIVMSVSQLASLSEESETDMMQPGICNLAAGVILQAVEDLQNKPLGGWTTPALQAKAQAGAFYFLRLDNEHFQFWCLTLDVEPLKFLKALNEILGPGMLHDFQEVLNVTIH